MKHLLFIPITFLVLISNLRSQTPRPITVKAGEDLNQVLGKQRFLYPEFINGTVSFRDGTSGSSRLNYNLLIGEVQFIDGKGDTLSVANESTIKEISIGNDKFYFDNGYLQLVDGNDCASLARKEKLQVVNKQKNTGYGPSSSASSASSYSSILVGTRVQALTANEELTFLPETTYYVGDKFRHFLPANKKNIIKLFSRQKNEIDQYLEEKKTVFTSEEDMKKLIGFVQGLCAK